MFGGAKRVLAALGPQQGLLPLDLNAHFLVRPPRPQQVGQQDGLLQAVAAAVIPDFIGLGQPAGTGISYQKFKLREANALAVAASAVRLTLDGGKIGEAVVVLGAVAPVPLMAEETAGILAGEEPTPELLDRAADKAAEESKPISDVRGSEDYRRKLVNVLTRRALDQALERAKGVEG